MVLTLNSLNVEIPTEYTSPERSALTIPAEKLPSASRATMVLATSAEVASTLIVRVSFEASVDT